MQPNNTNMRANNAEAYQYEVAVQCGPGAVLIWRNGTQS